MKEVIWFKEGNIAVLRMHRPKELNALNRAAVDAIDDAIEEIAGDEDISACLIHSEKNFAAGADIGNMAECDESEARAFMFSPTFNKIAELKIPTIAAIEGYALGGGLELALACDIRFASENAKIGFPEINLGIMPGAGGTIRAPRLIGEAAAKELIFSGDIISAQKGLEIGLINRVIPDKALYTEAVKFAGKLADKAPIALWTAKKTIGESFGVSMEKATELEGDNWAALFSTQDQKEGMRAFLEKRKPNYRGK